jgi:hypothetical protein
MMRSWSQSPCWRRGKPAYLFDVPFPALMMTAAKVCGHLMHILVSRIEDDIRTCYRALRPGIRVLQIESGPGAAAREIARRIGRGHVLGI